MKMKITIVKKTAKVVDFMTTNNKSAHRLQPKYDELYFVAWIFYAFIIVNSTNELSSVWLLKFLSHNAIQIVLSGMVLLHFLIKMKEKTYNDFLKMYKQRVEDTSNRNPFIPPLINTVGNEVKMIYRWKKGNACVRYINFAILCILSILKLKFTF
jgi:hypothetical protein